MGNRSLDIKIFVIIVAIALISKLFYIQVIDDSYKQGASANAIRNVVLYPQRGEVYDRNGLVLAQSEETYDLIVIPREISNLDTTQLCNLLETDKAAFIKQLEKAKNYSYHRPSIVLKQLPKEIKMRFDEFVFNGFYTQYRTIRSYPFHTAGNILGYVGEVNSTIIKQDSYYRAGDYSGMSGVERAYETTLRGIKGVRRDLVDVHGVVQGSYQNGAQDTMPIAGKSIVSTIDLELQLIGEELMQNKIGSVVAIEPATGEILMMVSSPTYNPDELIGNERSKNYSRLLLDPRKPLFNRAVMASYPPGSTFKNVTGLVGLQEGVVTPETRYSCNMGFYYGSRKLGCHSHASPLDMYYGIQTSCNAYFCNVYREILHNKAYSSVQEAFDKWHDHVESMGFGRRLNSDFIGELRGSIPTSDMYNRWYNGSWNAFTTISNSIGQGEIGVTPLQLANFISTVANGGYYYIPHIIKQIGDDEPVDDRFYQKNYTTIDPSHYEVIKEGMWRAVNIGGTAVAAGIEGMDVCGKTGTAENYHGKDHSTFASFAPRNDPKIVVSVYVENGGFGATIALPIAKLVMEKYLLGEIKSEALYNRIKDMKVNYKY